MTRRLLVRLLARLDASPLPAADPVRLDLESELMARLAAPRASRVRLRAAYAASGPSSPE